MPLVLGPKPETSESSLSGLSGTLYQGRLTEGVITGESAIETVVGDTTYTEAEDKRADRVFNNKLTAWADAYSILQMVVASNRDVIQLSLSTSVPVPNDGGAILQTQTVANITSNNTITPPPT